METLGTSADLVPGAGRVPTFAGRRVACSGVCAGTWDDMNEINSNRIHVVP